MNKEIAVFGGGCFWCTEATFQMLRGVISVMPGYAGGFDKLTASGSPIPPTYESVCSGKTGHAEVSKIEFDPEKISYNDLLTVFFAVHDPTTLNRQGNDVGNQYRSIILYTNETQKSEAEKFITKLSEDGMKVVTEVKPLEQFYEAESYHHNYFQKNPEKAYCQIVINPKLEKVKKRFGELLNSQP